jgi:prefoldin subunit 5
MAGAAQLDKDARLNLLRARADALTQQIESLRAEISALEGDDG